MNAEIAGLLSDNDNLGFNGLQVVVLVAVKQPLTLLLTAINLTTGSPQNSAGLQEQGQIIFIAKDRNCQQFKLNSLEMNSWNQSNIFSPWSQKTSQFDQWSPNTAGQ